MLTTGEGKVIDSMEEINAVGHRVLHGSEKYKVSTLVTDQVIEDIFAFRDLGPLHNPPQATAMKPARKYSARIPPWLRYSIPPSIRPSPEKAYIVPHPL